MTHKTRYYRTTNGSDHIPDPWAWIDVVVPPAIMFAAFAILIAVAVFAR